STARPVSSRTGSSAAAPRSRTTRSRTPRRSRTCSATSDRRTGAQSTVWLARTVDGSPPGLTAAGHHRWSVLRWRGKIRRRGQEVVGAGLRGCVARQVVAPVAVDAGHPEQHVVQSLLATAQPDEERAVVADPAVRDVAPQDLADLVLVGARDVGVGALVL